jgi:hypothetical protein
VLSALIGEVGAKVMSDDPLLREIDEELRQDQMKALWKRYGTLITAVVVVVVLGVAGFNGWTYWQKQQRVEYTARLAAAVDADALRGASGDQAKDIAAHLAGEVEALGGGTAALARLYQAAALTKSGDAAGAARVYDAVAGDAALPTALRDLARMLSVSHRIGIDDPASLQAVLEPYAVDGNPWRFTARELQAVLALRAGDSAKAREIYAALADAPGTPNGLRGRARELAAQLAGSGT